MATIHIAKVRAGTPSRTGFIDVQVGAALASEALDSAAVGGDTSSIPFTDWDEIAVITVPNGATGGVFVHIAETATTPTAANGSVEVPPGTIYGVVPGPGRVVNVADV